MLKYLIVFVALLTFASVATASEEEKVLGAVAGGILGSTVGKGDGKKAATVAGAVLGYKYGEEILGNDKPRREYSHENDDRHYRKYRSRNYNKYEYCESMVPARYERNRRVRESWIQGCINRLVEEEEVLARRAYRDGYRMD